VGIRYLSESVPAAPGALAPGVRWTIVALLTCFSTISYIERVNLAVAARFIRAEFGLTESQIRYSFSAFLVGYTLAQVPAGFLIDRYGWKRVLVAAGSLRFLITLLLGVFVGLLAANAAQVIATLVISRLLLGLVEAPTYPGASAAIVRWFPTPARGLPNAIIQAASYLGEAMTLVLLASITAYLGWRHALFASAVPALLIALCLDRRVRRQYLDRRERIHTGRGFTRTCRGLFLGTRQSARRHKDGIVRRRDEYGQQFRRHYLDASRPRTRRQAGLEFFICRGGSSDRVDRTPDARHSRDAPSPPE
jgi:MFS family permease